MYLRYKFRVVARWAPLRRPFGPVIINNQRAHSIMSSQELASDKPVLGTNLVSLPAELVGNVIDQVRERRDLANLRLVCKELDKHAATELFKDVLVSPSEEHIGTWNSITENDHIRRIPRHAIIHTQSDIDGEGNLDDYEEIGKDFEHALDALSRFPNLDSVEIGFTSECLGEDAQYWQEVREDAGKREDMLALIFRAIKRRASDKDCRTIRKLTIINLQNYPLPEFTSSDVFRDVMGQLEELHISMVQEYNEHGPDHDYDVIELQTFPAHLCSEWLKPISGNLRALSLYNKTDNWGPFPGYFPASASGLSFPKLQTLALGYYTLAHDNDLDWVFGIKSLKKLILSNCMIASFIRISKENMVAWKVQRHNWTALSNNEDNWCDDFKYPGKWSQFLDRVETNLPNLVDFRFDQASSYVYRKSAVRYGVKHRDDARARIFPRRYVCFDNGILPTHWPEATDDGKLHSWLDYLFPNLHLRTLEEDRESLDALLGKLRGRASQLA